MTATGTTPWPALVRLTLAVWLVYALTAGGRLATGDAVSMFEQAKSIVDRGDLDVPASQSAEAWRGTDGRYYAPFGIGQSLFDIPWLLTGRAISRLAGVQYGDPDRLPKALVAFASSVAAAGAVGAGFLLAWQLSNSVAGSLVAATVLAFSTPMWPYAKYGFNAPLAALTLCAGVYGIARGTTRRSDRALAAGGLALGAALLTRHELLLASVVALTWLAVVLRSSPDAGRRLAMAGIGIAAAVTVWSSLNLVRFGNPVWTGHSPGFSFAGAFGLTLSPTGSLALYAPAALAGLALLPLARRNATAALYLAVSAVLFAFYAALEDWHGTRSYGPRYLVPLLPLLVAPLAIFWASGGARLRSWLVVGCLASAALQLPPVLVDFSRAAIAAGQPAPSAGVGGWRSAPVVVTTGEAVRSVPRNLRYAFGVEAVPDIAVDRSRSLDERLDFSLDFWWLYLFYLGVLPRAAMLSIVLVMLGASAWLFRRAWRCGGTA